MLEELTGKKQVAFFSKVFEKLIALCQAERKYIRDMDVGQHGQLGQYVRPYGCLAMELPTDQPTDGRTFITTGHRRAKRTQKKGRMELKNYVCPPLYITR